MADLCPTCHTVKMSCYRVFLDNVLYSSAGFVRFLCFWKSQKQAVLAVFGGPPFRVSHLGR
eukprot:scaffold86560_cov27-Tisochrysis_lutea.AAC.1